MWGAGAPRPPKPPPPRVPPCRKYHKNHSVLEGVVSGIASYGNCFGVPNLGGETKFEPCYSGKPPGKCFRPGPGPPRRNFLCQGRRRRQSRNLRRRENWPRWDSRRNHASEEFTEASAAKRPNVQVGDPFVEKLLLGACLEAMKTGAIVAIQDMGAAGLTCSTWKWPPAATWEPKSNSTSCRNAKPA